MGPFLFSGALPLLLLRRTCYARTTAHFVEHVHGALRDLCGQAMPKASLSEAPAMPRLRDQQEFDATTVFAQFFAPIMRDIYRAP